MSRRLLLAVGITAVGALITFATLRGGLSLSIPLLLGVLLLVDGALRFSMLGEDARWGPDRDARPVPAGAGAVPRSADAGGPGSLAVGESTEAAVRPATWASDSALEPPVPPSTLDRADDTDQTMPPAQAAPGDEDTPPPIDARSR